MQPSLKIFVFYGILIFVIKSNFLAALNLYAVKIYCAEMKGLKHVSYLYCRRRK